MRLRLGGNTQSLRRLGELEPEAFVGIDNLEQNDAKATFKVTILSVGNKS